ncbi:hypothetical protein TSAR_003122 [Trichomalopsis sarcophagae]|uniref:mRNA cap guanine-N(7) methyltransferase n=1 Tax=Trichomalopsis sarcophagae TaxID=543379 RepID=A0A232F6X0_9HYME|nr:hypothetical protein TSAR_003122 [Trichomalopsis sarcophagae]
MSTQEMNDEVNDEINEKNKLSPSASDSPQQQDEATKDEQNNDAEPATSSPELKRKQNEDEEDPPSKIKRNPATDESSQFYNLPSDLSTSSSSREPEKKDDSEKSTDHASLVANHYNTLEEKGLAERNKSRIVYMRNFNNWVKSMLINEYLEKVRQGKSHGEPLRVLDMCCGKGGDLLKWRKGNINYLICADIAEVSVEQCRNRYKDMGAKRYPPLFGAEFLAYDCTKVRLREKYKDASMQLDLVSCQFAFHYSFETLPQAECMFKNASESLRPGGYFIGTIPNAYELVSRWQKADGNKFGNEIYSVEFSCDKTNPPLFGAKYVFHLEGVVNCPEFLVHLPTFIKLAWKFGLELIMFERFDEFYERRKEDGKTLLGKMLALETYPPYHEAPLLAENSQEYQHAVEYMQTSTGHRKIGTLSQSEWEAITLYSVFAFRKARSTWNAEGKPEFVKS